MPCGIWRWPWECCRIGRGCGRWLLMCRSRTRRCRCRRWLPGVLRRTRRIAAALRHTRFRPRERRARHLAHARPRLTPYRRHRVIVDPRGGPRVGNPRHNEPARWCRHRRSLPNERLLGSPTPPPSQWCGSSSAVDSGRRRTGPQRDHVQGPGDRGRGVSRPCRRHPAQHDRAPS